MIELHQFRPAWGINPSPFCMKVETYLRLAGLPYSPVSTVPMKGPKGKLPFIVDRGRKVPDSSQVIAYLKREYGDPLDGGLSAEQRSLGHLIQRTCEESLYFVLVYSRWLDAPGWDALRAEFFGGLPPVVRDVVPKLIRSRIARSLRGQGYGRHSRDEVYALGTADLEAIATLLGARPFLVEDHPTSYDAALYSFLVSVIDPPIDTPLSTYARARKNLRAYVDRMGAAVTKRVPA